MKWIFPPLPMVVTITPIQSLYDGRIIFLLDPTFLLSPKTPKIVDGHIR
jgi:hypothetical protein